MSDNLTEQEVRRRLVIFLRIPTEVWTDVLKLLPRRTLVQKIAPVCFRLKEISNKNVKSVHVIENAYQLKKKLQADDPEAKKHVEHLAGNKCQLAGQFRLSKFSISEKSLAILLTCPDLFKGCAIVVNFGEENKDSTLFMECLTGLENSKPNAIIIVQRVDQTNIFNWLHHQPNGMDFNGNGATDQQVRCMIVWLYDRDHIDWLINHSSRDIRQSQGLIDRRSFVLSFLCLDLSWSSYGQFRRIENKSTGEVLVLDRVMHDNGEPTNEYRLRRCMAEEEASGPEFYAGMFKRNRGYDEFKLGNGTTRVVIE